MYNFLRSTKFASHDRTLSMFNSHFRNAIGSVGSRETLLLVLDLLESITAVPVGKGTLQQ